MRSPVQIVGIILLTLLFVLFLAHAFTFTRGCGCATVKAREGFVARPTTPSQCQCLTGYIPSNTSYSQFGGNFVHFNGAIAFVPTGSSVKHAVPTCDMGCGVNACDPKIYQNIDEEQWNSLSTGETFSCDIMKQAKLGASAGTDIFFCQSVTNKQKTMPCY
jgi:hypothetical protein